MFNELDSAAHDNQLTSAERAARGASDPAAARAAQELRAVTSAVRNLPRNAAPPELKANIQQRLAALKSERPAEHSPRLRNWAWSLAAIAAALVLWLRTPTKPTPTLGAVSQAPAAASDDHGSVVATPRVLIVRLRSDAQNPAAVNELLTQVGATPLENPPEGAQAADMSPAQLANFLTALAADQQFAQVEVDARSPLLAIQGELDWRQFSRTAPLAGVASGVPVSAPPLPENLPAQPVRVMIRWEAAR